MSGFGNQQVLAAPQCAIDVFPFESQTSFSILGGQVLECRIEKDIRSGEPGRCSIVLAPGGPLGTATPPAWSEIITLQSLVVVALQRGNYSNVVFVGMVKVVGEGQQWHAGARVVRTIEIGAEDWASWFTDFNWSALSFLGATNGVATAEAADLGSAGQGLVTSVLADGQLTGNPGQIANGWLTRIMGGTEGILAQTNVPYPTQQGQNLLWPAATTSYFDGYPYGVSFPVSFFGISEAGDWESKFREILQWPWYELIIGTAPAGTWFTPPQRAPRDTPQPANSAAPTQTDTVLPTVTVTASPLTWYSSGQAFYSQSLPQAIPAQAAIVGRLMPMPDLTLDGDVNSSASVGTQSSSGLAGQQAYKFDSAADTGLWDALPLFTLDSGQNFIQSYTSLSMQSYYNFFVLNPIFYRPLLGQSQQAQGTFPFAYSAAANIASIHRFGFKSLQMDTYWMSDTAQLASQSELGDGQAMSNLVAALITRMATYYTPLVLQNQASVQMPLRPDIFPGCRFTYPPFRGGTDWEFYISKVRHTWKFGGPSTTQLELDRGLPTTVYTDQKLLAQVLQGNAQRVDGQVQSGLPAGEVPLQTFGYATDQLQTVLGQIAKIYATAQAQ